MEFMKCSVGGVVYGTGMTEVAWAAKRRADPTVPPLDRTGKAFKDDAFFGHLRSGRTPVEISRFLWLLSVCHSVVTEPNEESEYGVNYMASSPDEAALVAAAADLGYVFKGRTPETATVEVNGQLETVEVLANLEFTSARKRSSVVVKLPGSDDIVLFTKGADDLICTLLDPNDPQLDETKAHLRRFAADGLRTLCCAYRVLAPDVYEDWKQRYHQAEVLIDDRDAAINRVCLEVERDMTIVGATAIEDKLQVGVPDTIAAMLRAKINFWMITGDKRETAINIGFACSLLSGLMKLVILDERDPDVLRQTVNANLGSTDVKAMVACGDALEIMLRDEYVDDFFTLASACQSVICCRVSPSQKAAVVRMMRVRSGKVTLAIGDGANDVGMITEADVGVGISGKEGRQAVLASDYSFAQFRFLARLLLVHGRLNFYRNVELINYSFYKNMVCAFCQIIFQGYCSFSGNAAFNPLFMTVYNVLFTSVPPVIYAVLERDVGLQSMMNHPELYWFDGKRDELQGYPRFVLSLCLGIVHALAAFFVPYLGMKPFIDHHGYALGFDDFGTTVFCIVIAIVTFRIAAQCTYWTVLHHAFFWGSIVLFPIAVCVVSTMPVSMGLYKTGHLILGEAAFWFSLIGALAVAMSPVVGIESWQRGKDTDVNKIMHAERGKWRLEEEAELRLALGKAIPGDSIPQPETPVYVDQTNPTGAVFDVPELPVVARLRSQVIRDTEKYRSIYAFATVRPPKPSTFDLRLIDGDGDVPP
jgi:phospholipid-translocating P-type ATPase (flippase)